MKLDPEQYQQLLADMRIIIREELLALSQAPPIASEPVEEEWLTSREVAYRMGCTVNHVLKLLRDGAIPSVARGSRRYTSKSSLEAVLAKGYPLVKS